MATNFIHEALEDPALNSFATQLMSEEIAPVTETPDGININDYQQSVLARFGNAAVPYKRHKSPLTDRLSFLNGFSLPLNPICTQVKFRGACALSLRAG